MPSWRSGTAGRVALDPWRRRREGRFDYVELASDVAETKFFQFLFGEQIVEKLGQSYPSPRDRHHVPLWMYVCSQLSLRQGGHASRRVSPRPRGGEANPPEMTPQMRVLSAISDVLRRGGCGDAGRSVPRASASAAARRARGGAWDWAVIGVLNKINARVFFYLRGQARTIMILGVITVTRKATADSSWRSSPDGAKNARIRASDPGLKPCPKSEVRPCRTRAGRRALTLL